MLCASYSASALSRGALTARSMAAAKHDGYTSRAARSHMVAKGWETAPSPSCSCNLRRQRLKARKAVPTFGKPFQAVQ